MTVTQVAAVHRWIAVLLLAVAVVTAVVRILTGVSELVAAGVSVSTVLGGVFLLGLGVLTLFWVRCTVWLLRGTTAQVEVPGRGEVRVVEHRRVEQASEVAPEQITVHTFWRWSWVRAQGRAVHVDGREVPARTRVTFGVMGSRQHAEDAAAWVRSALQAAR